MDPAGLILVLSLLAAPNPEPPGQPVPAPASATAPRPGAPVPETSGSPAAAPAPSVRCDARAWSWLRGRTLSELLAQRLPDGTRITRVGDPPLSPEQTSGRLMIEIGRSTRVRQVRCG